MAPARERLIDLAGRVRDLPYVWPGPPDAVAARASGRGTCASKHALLAEELDAIGIPSLPLLVAGPLVPPILADDPGLAGAARLLEVHECLTVLTQWAGPLLVDVTWDPPLVRRGLAGSLDWDGATDMAPAIHAQTPGWSVP